MIKIRSAQLEDTAAIVEMLCRAMFGACRKVTRT